MNHSARKLLLSAVLAAVPAAQVVASDFPSEAIRFVVGYPPGGSTDITARVIAEHLSQTTDATFIVENRAGASGVVGATSVANSTPDGHTLMFAASPEVALVQALGRDVEYDVEADFRPITMLGQVEFVLVARSGLPVDDLDGLIAHAQENPGTLSFASFGTGTSNHLVGEAFKDATGTDMLHVPYAGSAPAMVDLLGGRVDIAFDTVPVVLPHMASGDLKPIGMATLGRSDLAPDIPTLDEQGLEGFVGGTWFGLFAPSGVDDGVIDWLNETVGGALTDESVRAQLAERGVALVHSTPEELAEFVSSEIARWIEVVETAGIEVE
jgi:tripartite-type tricarboxylate transporter receptor subunit TctC